jgi:hypothetical protein
MVSAVMVVMIIRRTHLGSMPSGDLATWLGRRFVAFWAVWVGQPRGGRGPASAKCRSWRKVPLSDQAVAPRT